MNDDSDQMDDLIGEMAGIAGKVPVGFDGPMADTQAVAVGLMIVQSLDFMTEAMRDINRTLDDLRARL